MLLQFLCLLSVSSPGASINLPVVDLGYERHQALAFNSTGQYYNFTNIRYGEAPTGERRFAAPVSPVNRSQAVVNGSQGGDCPAVFPCWFNIQTEFVQANLSSQPFDFDAAVAEQYRNGSCSIPVQPSQRNPQESEDCLFLDVIVPGSIFNQNDSTRSTKGAAVIIYIYGGGYTGGSKTSSGNPAGLIYNSRANGSEGVIYVGINYRLGTLGFMYGSDFSSSGGLVNAGLYDQRLALQWVQNNIHKFGGDPNRVTVMGESAGGGSIMMQMTAYGSGESPPFQQAITQSPAWEPGSAGPTKQNEIYQRFLGLLNITTLEEARQLPSQAVIDANHILISSIEYGATFLGPVIDGIFIPEDPKRLFLKNSVDPHVKLLTTHARNEGLRFAPANISTDTDFAQWVGLFVNSANASVLQEITTSVYPPLFNGSLPYTTQLQRAQLFWAEMVSICNPRYMHRAAQGSGYYNEFDVAPALHQGDVPYVFWNGAGSDLTVNETVAKVTQSYITAFAITGNANNPGSPPIRTYDGTHVLDMSGTAGFGEILDVTKNSRCEYWQRAMYD